MAQVIIDGQNLTNIANAIRTKNKGAATYLPSEMANAVLAINTDPSGDATATAAQIKLGETAYVQGQKITGTAAVTYNSETKELNMPGWAVTLE